MEQALLSGMAAVAGPDGMVTTSDLVAATGRSTPQWSLARRSLIDKGLIESTGRGTLRFTMPSFAEFVREITGIDHLGPGLPAAATPPALPGTATPRRPPPAGPNSQTPQPPTH